MIRRGGSVGDAVTATDDGDASTVGGHSQDNAAFVGVNARFLKTCGKGTVMYMAPELWERGEKYDAFSTDIWALGVILYLMLHARYPFSVNRIKASVRRRRAKQPVDLTRVYGLEMSDDNLSPGAVDLIRRIVCIDPNNRISLNGILNHPWMCKVSRQSIVGVLRDGGVFAVRRQGWVMYRGHGMLGRLVNKRRWVTVGGGEIRVYGDDGKTVLKKYMRLGPNTKLHDIDFALSEIVVTTSDEDGDGDGFDDESGLPQDRKRQKRIAIRYPSTDQSILKEWHRAIAVEIKSARGLADAEESTKTSLSAGLEEASLALKNGEISWETYSALRRKILLGSLG